jgi:hypothetical protein
VQPSGLPAVSKTALCVAKNRQGAAPEGERQKRQDADANSFILVVIGICGQTSALRLKAVAQRANWICEGFIKHK